VRRVFLRAESADGEAAWRWLESLPDLQISREAPLSIEPETTDVLWLHGPAPAPEGLRPWLERGGRLLATLEAATIAVQLELETVRPDEQVQGTWHHADDEFWLPEFRSFKAFPHLRGLAAFGPHPLFHQLNQGTYTWAPAEGESYSRIAYLRHRPASAGVVAVERSFIHLNAERIVAWEYPVGAGGILCIGGFIHPAAPDQLLCRQLNALLGNAITGDAIPHRDRALPVTLWPSRGRQVRRDSSVPVPSVPKMEEQWAQPPGECDLEGPVTEDAPWTLAGRRILITGHERSGLHEVWSHPVRLIRAATLHANGKVPRVTTVRVSPDQVSRRLESVGGSLEERWTAGLERPVMVWEVAGDGDEIRLSWTADLRRMWPYPEGALGDLRWNLSSGGDRVWLGTTGSSIQALFTVDGGRFLPPVETVDPAPAIELTAVGSRRVRVVAVGSTESADLSTTLRALERKRFDGLQRQRWQHTEQLHTYGAGLETPDRSLDLAFEWAKVRTDSFLAETPGIGRSLLAGYAGSRPGWGDGRPGYAWYFGRDACWTAFAQLAAGQREAARDVIRFLSQTQDVSGKILHEYTTSGLVHYDAADSTPLYLLLVGRYAAWTGDLEYLRKYWDQVERAFRFCLETDTDGDGLIENTRVGHGWIEHGPLGGAHVSLYLAACWVAALEGLEPVAEGLGRADLAEELRERCLAARAAIARRFRVGGEFALGLDPAGSPQMHRTAMLAVPILLGAVDPGHCGYWLDAIAGPDFTTPWGVRMIAASDPLFDPQGYHLGAVWPLYTGWVSLAEWRAGRFQAAFDHLLANARLVPDRARGAFDEVLHGLEYRAAGVCPDQAWSAAMVLSPVIEGLWGIVPRALDDTLTLTPWMPEEWDRMSLRRLRVGRTVLDLELRRKPGQLLVRIRRTFGPGIRMRLAPRTAATPVSFAVDEVELGGAGAQFQVSDQHEVVFSF
jgi:glycogen debranching enzyme